MSEPDFEKPEIKAFISLTPEFDRKLPDNYMGPELVEFPDGAENHMMFQLASTWGVEITDLTLYYVSHELRSIQQLVPIEMPKAED